jgi:YD repeat-containing protein
MSLDRFSVNRTIARTQRLTYRAAWAMGATRGVHGCSLPVCTMRTAPAGRATRVRCDEEGRLAANSNGGPQVRSDG